MKKTFAGTAEFILFLLLDVLGGVFYHPFHAEMKLGGDRLASRVFIWDGLILMLIAWVLLLLFSSTRRRLAAWAPHSTIALGLAALAGFLLKVGFITHNW